MNNDIKKAISETVEENPSGFKSTIRDLLNQRLFEAMNGRRSEIFESHDDERTTESLAEEVIENLTADELIETKAEDYADDALFEAKVEKLISEEEYELFFKKALKKFGVSSPAELKTVEKKKEFFNYIDDNFQAKNEKDEDVHENRHPGRTDAGSDRPKIVGGFPIGNKDGRQFILDPSTFQPIAPYRPPVRRTTRRRRGGELA